MVVFTCGCRGVRDAVVVKVPASVVTSTGGVPTLGKIDVVVDVVVIDLDEETSNARIITLKGFIADFGPQSCSARAGVRGMSGKIVEHHLYTNRQRVFSVINVAFCMHLASPIFDFGARRLKGTTFSYRGLTGGRGAGQRATLVMGRLGYNS